MLILFYYVTYSKKQKKIVQTSTRSSFRINDSVQMKKKQ